MMASQSLPRPAIALALLGALLSPGFAAEPGQPHGAKLVILVFSGLQAAEIQQGIHDNRLPGFASLAARGGPPVEADGGARLPLTRAVGWARMALGKEVELREMRELAPWETAVERHIPGSLGRGTQRGGAAAGIAGEDSPPSAFRPFWMDLDRAGVRCTLFGIPFTYPLPALPNGRVLSSPRREELSAWRQGWTIYSPASAPGMGQLSSLDQLLLDFAGPEAESVVRGPWEPAMRELWESLRRERSRQIERLGFLPMRDRAEAVRRIAALQIDMDSTWRRGFVVVPMSLSLLPFGAGVEIQVQGQRETMAPGHWSGVFRIAFPEGQGREARGLCQFYLIEARPAIRLLASPVQPDPTDAASGLVAPPSLAESLRRDTGPFDLLSNEAAAEPFLAGEIGAAQFLNHLQSRLDRRASAFQSLFGREDWDFFFGAFDDLDTLGSLRVRDEDTSSRLELANARRDILLRFDSLISKASSRLGSADRLMVVSRGSSHATRKLVNLNKALEDGGLLKSVLLEDGESLILQGGPVIDWRETQAIVAGPGLVYLLPTKPENPGEAVVQSAEGEVEARVIKAISGLSDPETGESIVEGAQKLPHGGAQSLRGGEARLVVALKPGYALDTATIGGGLALESVFRPVGAWIGRCDIASVEGEAAFVMSNSSVQRCPFSLTAIAGLALEFFGAPRESPAGAPTASRQAASQSRPAG